MGGVVNFKPWWLQNANLMQYLRLAIVEIRVFYEIAMHVDGFDRENFNQILAVASLERFAFLFLAES